LLCFDFTIPCFALLRFYKASKGIVKSKQIKQRVEASIAIVKNNQNMCKICTYICAYIHIPTQADLCDIEASIGFVKSKQSKQSKHAKQGIVKIEAKQAKCLYNRSRHRVCEYMRNIRGYMRIFAHFYEDKPLRNLSKHRVCKIAAKQSKQSKASHCKIEAKQAQGL